MGNAEQRRTAWSELPAELHQTVAEVLGGPVTSAVSQSNGFSPGSADRVTTAEGRRAFVKAVHRDRNPGTFELHSREIAVMTAMPAGVRAPTLLGSYRADDWVALILSDIDGRHPGEALDGSDAEAVLDALATFSAVPVRTLDELPRAAEEFLAEAAGWAELLADGALGELPPWVQGSVDRLRAAADRVASAVEGENLVHLDCRADNVLIDRAGAAWIVDWPWACIGAGWVDGLSYLLDARVRGDRVDADVLLREHPLFTGVPAGSIDAVLAAITGSFFNKARQPAPPNMPALRDFQRREALAGADWLRERWS
jgi:hypothetical protein